MTKNSLLILAALFLATAAAAQPEFYSDAFLGLPEFRALPVRLPTADGDSAQIEVHIKIVYDDLQFVKKDTEYNASYEVDVNLRKPDGSLTASGHLERGVTVASYVETNSRVRGDQTSFLFTLLPGKFNLRIDLLDKETRKSRVLEKELEFRKKDWKKPLQLGDIVIIDSTGSAHMSYGLIQGKPIQAAYKLYSQSAENIRLSYQLRDSDDEISESGSIPLSDHGSLYADTLSLPTDSLNDSHYQLILIAQTDENSVMRSYSFDLLLQNLPSYIHNLDMAILQLKYVASDDEYHVLTKAHSSKKEQLFREFWKRKDPTPATPANEKMEEYYRRVNYANEQFKGYRGGWSSDMGHVYIVYGSPTDIERHPFDIDTKPYEIWYYYDINRKFIFQDREGFSQYRLVSSFWDDF